MERKGSMNVHVPVINRASISITPAQGVIFSLMLNTSAAAHIPCAANLWLSDARQSDTL